MTRRVVRAARQTRKILLFTALVLALLVPTLPATATTVAVAGTVSDADTHLGIEAAEVWVMDDAYEYVTDTATTSLGAFEIASLPGNGIYWIDFWREGYAYEEVEVNYVGAPLVVNVDLQPLTVVATGTVTSSATGLPIEEAWIYVEDFDNPDFYGYATTDADGHYTIYDEADAGAGTLTFHAEAEGFRPTDAEADWNGTDILTQDFELEPAPLIVQGLITDAKTGKPIPDAWLWAGAGDGWDYTDIGWANTDENGKYRLYDLYDAGPTPFTLYVDADGYEAIEVDLTWNGTSTITKNIQLRPLFPWTGNVNVVPIEGENRYSTAVQGSRMAFPNSNSCDEVVLASGENFPDALGGSSLAGALKCPVLLTKPGQLSSVTASEIKRLGAKTAWVIGGDVAVSDAVLTSLKNLGITPRRIAGANRYETAALVAQKTANELGPLYNGDVMFATGENFPDALAAAPLAAFKKVPILLVKTGSVPKTTLDAIDNIAATRGIVLGGDTVVTVPVYNTLKKKFPADSTMRLFGKDRYATACAVAEFGVDEYGLSWGGTGFATGTTFPDALAGGTVQGLISTVMLLTKSDSVPGAVSNTIDSYGSQMNELHFYGGTAAITTSVRSQITNHVKAMHLP